MIERILTKVIGIFLALSVLIALTWPIILVFILAHFLVRWW